jgi:hypothetical protein
MLEGLKLDWIFSLPFCVYILPCAYPPLHLEISLGKTT